MVVPILDSLGVRKGLQRKRMAVMAPNKTNMKCISTLFASEMFYMANACLLSLGAVLRIPSAWPKLLSLLLRQLTAEVHPQAPVAAESDKKTLRL